MSGIGEADHYPRQVGWSRLNRSRCLTSDRSVAANPSLESRDSPLKEKATLLSMELPAVKGVPFKMAQTLNCDLRGDFGWSARPLARPLARLRVGANCHIQRLHYLLSSWTPFPTTFDPAKWNYDQMSEADPRIFQPKQVST